MVGPYLKTCAIEQRLYVLQQKFVLKDSAREDDDAKAMLQRHHFDGRKQPLSNPSLKCPGNLMDRASANPVGDDALKQWAKIEFVIGERKGIRVCIDRAFSLPCNCSTQIAAWPSKVDSLTNPSSAAAASKSLPIDVVEKVRTPLRTSSRAS